MIEQQVFNNRYRLDRKLGEGGMATVYCGTDTLLRRRVAVKVLREQYASDDEFVRRFYQEAESAARLNHPNIVNTYDVGREGDTYYIVMELVDGPSLAEVIAADGRLPEPVAIDYAAQVCSGLAYAHRQGLLHRDIKPANILVTKDDVVKLSDFGIARAVSQQTMAMTKPGLVMGSVFYLSPEQAQGHELHETSDLYSVGIVLYQMLTGKLPYSGDSPVTVALKHISEPVPTLDARGLGVSPALSAIVNRLLQKKPTNRFQSASDVASALREARERPSFAAYATSDDSPTQSFATVVPQPPPRPSRNPDRAIAYTSISDDEARATRSGGRIIAVLVAALALAVALGYILFGHPFSPLGAQTIAVADFRNMSDRQAIQTLTNAGLGYKVRYASSDTVAANHVISQNPGAGSTVAQKNGVVELIVSNGQPTVGLPDFRTYTVIDATKDLQAQKFRVKVEREFNAAPKDSVVEQKPRASSKVRPGSLVVLYVSDGPKPIAIPSLIGKKLSEANAIAARDGFVLNVTQRAPFDNIPVDTIASQDPSGGMVIPHSDKAVVNVTVSTGAGAAAVPNVVSSDAAAARQALAQAGFQTKLEYAIRPGSPDNGQVIDQTPQPNAMAPRNSVVMLVLSVPGEVPDTQGLSVDDARARLRAAGYDVGNLTYTTEGSGGNVVRTEPEAGTQKRPGEVVNIIVNSTGKP